MVAFKNLPAQFSEKTPLIVTGVAALLVGIIGTPVIQSVTALGRLEPQGEIISISAPSSNDGSRIEALRVKEGDRLKSGDIVAVLNSQKRLQAALNQAESQVRVTQAKLAQVQSGAKSGEIQAQRSEIARLNAEKTGDLNTQSAVVGRLTAELAGAINTQKATRERLQAEYNNAQLEADRYDQLFADGATSASLRDSKRLAAQTALRKGEEADSEAQRVRNTLNQQITEAKFAKRTGRFRRIDPRSDCRSPARRYPNGPSGSGPSAGSAGQSHSGFGAGLCPGPTGWHRFENPHAGG
jgi:multidrug resistance efflux pump